MSPIVVSKTELGTFLSIDNSKPLLSKYKFLFVNVSIPVVFSLYSPILNSSSMDWETDELRNEYFENSKIVGHG